MRLGFLRLAINATLPHTHQEILDQIGSIEAPEAAGQITNGGRN